MLKAAKILEQQVPHKFPGVQAIAAHCQISPTKLKRDFKEVHGVTLLEYYRSQQMIYVIDLLNGREKTVKELAVMLGFKKVSAFSIWYRKISGTSHFDIT